MKLLVNTELKDTNLISATNSKVIRVAKYPINNFKFSYGELNELDQIIKGKLRVKSMLERQASDKRPYLSSQKDYWGLKSLRMCTKRQNCVWHATCTSPQTNGYKQHRYESY